MPPIHTPSPRRGMPPFSVLLIMIAVSVIGFAHAAAAEGTVFAVGAAAQHRRVVLVVGSLGPNHGAAGDIAYRGRAVRDLGMPQCLLIFIQRVMAALPSISTRIRI